MYLMRRLLDHPHLLLTLTSLFWAGNAVIGRAVVDEIPPVTLAWIRWGLAFLILIPFTWRDVRADLAIVRRHLWTMVLLSLTGVGAFTTMQYWSLQHTTAINVSVMQSASPLLIGLWSWLLWRDPLTRGQVGGILTSLIGVLVIISAGELARWMALSLNVGDVAILLAIALYALYSALLRKRPALTPLTFLTVTVAFGVVMLSPVAAAEYLSGARIVDLSSGGYAALAYVAVFPSILAYLFFNRGVQLIGANRAGPFFHLIPLFGSLLAILFLGERPGWHHPIGAILIIGGVLIAGRTRPPGIFANRVAPKRATD